MTVKPRVDWSTDGQENKCKAILFEVETPLRGNIHELKQLWGNHLKHNLTEIAQPLLSGISRRLEEIHHSLLAWGKAGRDWDRITWGRSAIEAHEQDRYAEPIDVLIDAARDALEWLAINQLASLEAWIERLVVSDVPLLRRLAIHAITVHPAISSDEQLDWLIKRVGLHVQAEHHEVYRAVARAYPAASERMRQLVIDAVFQYQFPVTSGCKLTHSSD